MTLRPLLLLILCLIVAPAPARADEITLAAGAELKYIVTDLVDAFHQANPQQTVNVVFVPTPLLMEQLRTGVSFDVLFLPSESMTALLREKLIKGTVHPF
ncbi:MAG TPA: substrate-binding domain-containing protein, partial [Geobacterales bacterium]|nr:substrate-binding domain-containing protein [Geobacterales bacterium]